MAAAALAIASPAIQRVAAAPSYDNVVEITVPVEGDFTDDFRAGRAGGRVHRATDIFNEMGAKVYAAMGGTVTWAPEEEHPTAGFALQIEGDDGRKYAYYHLGEAGGSRSEALADGIDHGVRVERGQLIGYLGNSGNAVHTPPHLHFEIHDRRVTDPYGSNRINPYASLKAAAARGDYPDAVGDPPPSRDHDPAPGEHHIVSEGETLSGIAREHGLDGWEELLELNDEISDPDLIHPGQVLRLIAVREHTVAEGDTLSGIAREHGLDDWEPLLELNPEIAEPDLIHPGDVVRVPTSRED